MSAANDKRVVALVTACMRSDGRPAFAHTEVAVTPEEAENGVQYYLVEGKLLQQGFEEPMVHFGEEEIPAFLFSAVKDLLGSDSTMPEPTYLSLAEKS